jgi:hypothetical protein
MKIETNPFKRVIVGALLTMPTSCLFREKLADHAHFLFFSERSRLTMLPLCFFREEQADHAHFLSFQRGAG